MQCKRYQDFIREYQYYRKFLFKYRKTGIPFKDHYFHPILNIPEPKVNFKNYELEWRRVDEVYKAPLFEKQAISVDFIQQGIVSDCYFISALTRIAKQPELVERLFDKTADTVLGKEKNSINIKCGAVVIFFRAFGRETPVLIDTKLPFHKGTNTLICSRPLNLNASPWFCLVEKAYAKLFGSYSNICYGFFTYSIYTLFGYQPYFKYISDLKKDQKKKNKTPFQQILEYKKQGAVMSCSIDNYYKVVVPENEVKSAGLISNHSYLLLKIVDYKGMHFYRLRNPWATLVWKGDWSDNSPLWTEEIKQALKMKKSNDGSFWMIEKDFFHFFTRIDVSRPIPKSWHSKSFTLEMWPGKYDGCDPEKVDAHLEQRPNYAIRIKQKPPAGKTAKFFFLAERRSYLQDEVKLIDDKPSSYRIYFVYSYGKKLSRDVLKSCYNFYFPVSENIIYCEFELSDISDTYTLAVQRMEKRNEFDECSIRVICKYDFDLYSIDNPKHLISENDNSGKVFTNGNYLNYIFTPQNDASDKQLKMFLQEDKKKVVVDGNKNKKDDPIKKKALNDNKKVHHQKQSDDKNMKDDPIKKKALNDDKKVHQHKQDDDKNKKDDPIKKKALNDDKKVHQHKQDDDKNMKDDPNKNKKEAQKHKKDNPNKTPKHYQKHKGEGDNFDEYNDNDDDDEIENIIKERKKDSPIQFTDRNLFVKIKSIRDHKQEDPIRMKDILKHQQIDNAENSDENSSDDTEYDYNEEDENDDELVVINKEEKLSEEIKSIQLKVPEIVNQQSNLHEEINKIYKDIENESDADAVNKMKQKINIKRNILESLDEQVNLLLVQFDENSQELEKTIHKKKIINRIKNGRKPKPKPKPKIRPCDDDDDDDEASKQIINQADVNDDNLKKKSKTKKKIIPKIIVHLEDSE